MRGARANCNLSVWATCYMQRRL